MIVRTRSGERRARATLQRNVEAAEQTWMQQLWHLSNQRFACEADARSAGARALRRCPVWFEADTEAGGASYLRPARAPAQGRHTQEDRVADPGDAAGQPRAGEVEALRAACFIVGTNVLDPKRQSRQELVTTSK